MFLGCFLSVSAATKYIFESSVDRKKIALNATVTLTLTVNYKSYTDLQFPQETEDYKVISQLKSSRMQYVNGVVTQEKNIQFYLQPKHPGEMQIPAASVRIEGALYETEPIIVNVLNKFEKQKPKTNNRQRESIYRSSGNNNNSRQNIRDPFSKALVSRLSPYKNEQILLRLKVYHRGNLESLNIPIVNLDNFVQEQVKDAREYKETVDGVQYLVYELSYILFPIKSGQIVIPPAIFKAQVIDINPYDPFANFFGSGSKRGIEIKSNPITLNVKDLPAGAPKGFTGYVGDLTMKSSLSKKDVETGEATTLNTTIYGNGNLNLLNLDFVENSKQYNFFKDSTNQNSEIENQRKYSRITMKAAVIPKKAGKIGIKINPLISFNPILKKYEEHGRIEFTVNVKQGTDNSNTSNLDSNEEYKGFRDAQQSINSNEILTISNEQIADGLSTKINPWLLIFIFIFINLAALASYLYKFLNHKLEDPRTQNSNQIKFSDYEKTLKKVISIEDLSKTMKDLSNQIENKIKASNNGFDAEHANKIREDIEMLLKECDAVNYGQGSADLGALQLSAISIVKDLRSCYGN